jgi:threonine/homoserine/homoserine lactone efflux protein
MLSNLGNPKMAVFFTSLLPQFASSFPGLLSLGLCFCCLTLLWLSAYAVAVGRARRILARERVRRALDCVTGAALVALGLRLAAERA